MQDVSNLILRDVSLFFSAGFGLGTTLYWLGVAFRSFYDLTK